MGKTTSAPAAVSLALDKAMTDAGVYAAILVTWGKQVCVMIEGDRGYACCGLSMVTKEHNQSYALDAAKHRALTKLAELKQRRADQKNSRSAYAQG